MAPNIGLGDATNPDHGFRLYITALVMVLVAGICVMGRLLARFHIKAFGMDDFAICVSLVRVRFQYRFINCLITI